MRTLLRERTRFVGVERLRRRIADIAFRYAALEAIRRSVGLESNDRLVDLARREQPHVPPVRRIDVAARQLRERLPPAAFELDVVLRMAVVAEARGDARVGGRESVEVRERFALRQRLRPSELDIQIDERNRERKKTRRDEERSN